MKVLMLSNQGRSMATFWHTLMETMASRGMDVVCCVPDASSELAAQGHRVINYSLDRKGINPISDMQTLIQLRRIFAAERPDILFATTIKPVIYGSLAAKWAGVPHIFATITGLGYAFERDSLIKKIINGISCGLYRRSLKDVSGIFFQNRDDARLFREARILDANAPVFFARGVGVNTEHFAMTPLPPADAPTFLLVARLLEAKGIYDYARAAAILKEKYPRSRFQLLGPPETGRGSIPLKEIGQMAAIEYLGQTADVRPCWENAHVAVLPSWREGLPTALMEAMSMGRPLVTTDVPGCREVLRPGKNGFFAQARDAQSLALAMGQFLEHPELMASMGAASRKMATENFDAGVVANGILDDMESAILKRPSHM